MVIVQASGDVFISTGSLDGEKTLKPKTRIKELEQVYSEKQSIGQGLIFGAQAPDMAINHFEGFVEYKNQKIMIKSENFIMRGAVVRNTAWVMGNLFIRRCYVHWTRYKSYAKFGIRSTKIFPNLT